MKAAYYTGNKSFSLEEVSVTEPAAGEVSIDVAFCGICGTDMHVYHGVMDARIGNHRVIGHEMSGTISAIGEGVSELKVGDPVVVRPLDHCGECPACKRGHTHVCQNLKFLGLDTDGAFQEFWTVPAHTVHKLPADLALDHAALVEPAAVACHDVKRSRLVEGEDVLVIGGGPIGLLIAMVAKAAGGNVILSEVSESRLALASKLGIDTLNPKHDDVPVLVHQKTNDKGADVVFEVSGTQAGVDAMTASASVRGRIVMVAIHSEKPQVDMFQFFWRELELLGARVYDASDYQSAIELIQSGAIDCEAMITDVSDLDQIQLAFSSLDEDSRAMKSLIKCS